MVISDEDIIWDDPDHWMAVVKTGNEGIFCCVKNNLARLQRIPNPGCGLHYGDIIKVKGPTGKKYMIRDEEIEEFEMTELVKPSGCNTYLFAAIIPSAKDYFALQDMFMGDRLNVEIPYNYMQRPLNYEWQQGYCAAPDIYLVKILLKKFCEGNIERKVINIIAEQALF